VDLNLVVFGMIWMTWLLAAIVIFAVKTRSNAVRILALDSMTLVLVAVMVLFAASRGEVYYMDTALALALVSFVSTVAASRWLAAGRVL
jgi:multicomponent Na+:H+ antiporter subunit F